MYHEKYEHHHYSKNKTEIVGVGDLQFKFGTQANFYVINQSEVGRSKINDKETASYVDNDWPFTKMVIIMANGAYTTT
jgi:hypothetical protein